MSFKILENANKLIKSKACLMFRPLGRNIEFGRPSVPSLSLCSSPLSFFNDNRSKPHLNARLTQTQSLLLLSNY